MADFDLLEGLRLEQGHGRDNSNPSFSRKVRSDSASSAAFPAVDDTAIMIAASNPDRLELIISVQSHPALIGFNDTDQNFLVLTGDAYRTTYYTGEVWAKRSGASDPDIYITEISLTLPPPPLGSGLILSTGDYFLLAGGGKLLLGD